MADPRVVPLESVWLLVLKDLGLEAENVLRRARLARDLFSQERPRLSVEADADHGPRRVGRDGIRPLPGAELRGEVVSPRSRKRLWILAAWLVWGEGRSAEWF